MPIDFIVFLIVFVHMFHYSAKKRPKSLRNILTRRSFALLNLCYNSVNGASKMRENIIITIEDFTKILDEIIKEIPEEIFIGLNGGVTITEDAPLHPDALGEDLYILGQYHEDPDFGRYIHIYFGSFIECFGNSNWEAITEECEAVIKHELLHHLETMAGEKNLEVQDELDLDKHNRGELTRRRISKKLDIEVDL